VKLETQGWYSERDLTNQCSECYWVLKEHRLACCEYAKHEFPHATKCQQFDVQGANE
jgi:hypothetical protein